jgi:hypothetical protein
VWNLFGEPRAQGAKAFLEQHSTKADAYCQPRPPHPLRSSGGPQGSPLGGKEISTPGSRPTGGERHENSSKLFLLAMFLV